MADRRAVLIAIRRPSKHSAARLRTARSAGRASPTLEDFDGIVSVLPRGLSRDPGGDGGDWSVDWPRADENLSIRLSELDQDARRHRPDGTPKHLLVRLTDPIFFRCPFIMMTEVGVTYLDESEAANLREYLLKGGFLWADDFWGEYAWQIWEQPDPEGAALRAVSRSSICRWTIRSFTR